jgi:hypothetical protein
MAYYIRHESDEVKKFYNLPSLWSVHVYKHMQMMTTSIKCEGEKKVLWRILSSWYTDISFLGGSGFSQFNYFFSKNRVGRFSAAIIFLAECSGKVLTFNLVHLHH